MAAAGSVALKYLTGGMGTNPAGSGASGVGGAMIGGGGGTGVLGAGLRGGEIGGPRRNNWLGRIFSGGGGGSVPYAAGVDTVPAMLSGGEFVMNPAATQNIGRGNLAALNAGGGGDGDGAIVAAINNLGDELDGNGETVINITVNDNGTETQDTNGNNERQQNLALRIRDVVRETIQEEQRLGGTLRRV